LEGKTVVSALREFAEYAKSKRVAGAAPAVASPIVTGVQKALKKLGFDPGTIDGIMSPKTKAAIQGFQLANGLAADGIVGPETQAALAKALAGALAAKDGAAAATSAGPAPAGPSAASTDSGKSAQAAGGAGAADLPVQGFSLGMRGASPAGGAGALDATSTDLFFNWDSAELTTSDKKSLDAYAKAYLAAKSPETVFVDAYASEEGNEEHNKKLSEKRAEAVAGYLKQQGVPKVEGRGHGATKKFGNDLRQNRRATIKPPPPTISPPPPTAAKPKKPLQDLTAEEIHKAGLDKPEYQKEEEPATKKPEAGGATEATLEGDLLKGDVETQVKVTIGLRAKKKDDPSKVQVLPDQDFTVHIGKDSKPKLEWAINLLRVKLMEKKIGLLGIVGLEGTVSLGAQVGLDPKAMKEVEKKIKAELEAKLGSFSLKGGIEVDPTKPTAPEVKGTIVWTIKHDLLK
jgi:outer membrane protein OmpA-like peptidoglycan-associated protein